MEKIDFRAEGKQLAWDYLLVTLGALLTAFAFAAFFLPHDIAPGGVTGIATVLSSVTGLNVGLLSFLINLPLFAIGWRRVGLRFAVRSFISMILLSLLIDVMPESAANAVTLSIRQVARRRKNFRIPFTSVLFNQICHTCL